MENWDYKYLGHLLWKERKERVKVKDRVESLRGSNADP